MQLPASATIDEAAALAAALPAALAAEGSGGAWRIDAGAVQACDSATIALLLHARRLASAAGRPLEIVGVPPKLVQLARLYGVDGLLLHGAA